MATNWNDLQAFKNLKVAIIEKKEKELEIKNKPVDEYEWINDSIAQIRKFSELSSDHDFDIIMNMVNIPVDFITREHEMALDRHNLHYVRLVGTWWVDTPVLALNKECWNLYLKAGKPYYMGSFIERMIGKGYKSSMDSHWVPVMQDVFMLAAQNHYIKNGVYYLLLMPVDYVKLIGFLDTEDKGRGSARYAWNPYA